MMKRLLILNICLYAQARNLIEMPVPDVDSRQMERAMEDVGVLSNYRHYQCTP